jgi:hypothetical protein
LLARWPHITTPRVLREECHVELLQYDVLLEKHREMGSLDHYTVGRAREEHVGIVCFLLLGVRLVGDVESLLFMRI